MRGSVRRLLLDRACCQRRWCKQEKEKEEEEKEKEEQEEEEEEVWCAQLPPSGPEHHRTRQLGAPNSGSPWTAAAARPHTCLDDQSQQQHLLGPASRNQNLDFLNI